VRTRNPGADVCILPLAACHQAYPEWVRILKVQYSMHRMPGDIPSVSFIKNRSPCHS
jgi:hypothetical protein